MLFIVDPRDQTSRSLVREKRLFQLSTIFHQPCMIIVKTPEQENDTKRWNKNG